MQKKHRFLLLGLATVAICGGAYFWLRSSGNQAQAYYERGLVLAKQHEYAKASIELRNALRKQSGRVEVWRALAEVAEASRQWNDLIQSLQSVVSLAPDDNETRIKLAKLLALSGRVYEALDLVQSERVEDEQNARIVGLRAAILYRLYDRRGAVREAKKALGIDRENPDALVVLANERMAAGDLTGALQILNEQTSHNQPDLGIRLLKVKIFEELGDKRQVELLLRELVETYPKDVVFRKQLISYYLGESEADKAEKEVRALVQENPADSEVELELVRFLSATKGPSAARNELVSRIQAGGEVFPYEIALADLEFRSGKFVDAEMQLRDLLTRSSSDEQALAARNKLAEMLLKRGKTNEAEQIASEVLSKDGGDANALRIRASVRISRGQTDLAIVDLKQALSTQPRSPELKLLLALAYEHSGSMALADKEYSEAVRVSNYDSNVGINYVSFLLRRGNPQRAEQFLVELSKRTPTNLDVLSALAQVELGRGNWTEAQSVADRIRRADPANHDAIADQVLGAALLGQHKFNEGIAIFQAAVSASPLATQPMVSLVRALILARKNDEAISFLKRTLSTHPENAEAWVLLGTIQVTIGDRNQGLASFQKAVDQQPTNIVGYLALADFYGSEKEFEKALSAARSGLRMHPESLELRMALADTFEKSDQYEAAIKEYEGILSQRPGSMVAANNLASLLSEHRDDKASLERAHALVASLGETQIPQFKDTLGWINYRRNDYINAIPLLEKAVAGLPDMPLVRYHLAMGYIAVGQGAKAKEQLSAALGLSPVPALKAKIHQALQSQAAL